MNSLTVHLSSLVPLAAEAPAGDKPGPSLLVQMMPLILIFFVFYFLIIRPQSKRRRERMDMLNTVQKGDRVITTGGIHGVVTVVRDHDVTILCEGDGVKLKFQKSGIAHVLPDEGSQPTE